jgi:hypothetical protein
MSRRQGAAHADRGPRWRLPAGIVLLVLGLLVFVAQPFLVFPGLSFEAFLGNVVLLLSSHGCILVGAGLCLWHLTQGRRWRRWWGIPLGLVMLYWLAYAAVELWNGVLIVAAVLGR